MALIVVDDSSQNAIVIVAGGNGHLSPAVLARHEHLLEQAQVVVCQLESPLETVGHVLRRAHALGKTVILNPAPATRDVPADWLPDVYKRQSPSCSATRRAPSPARTSARSDGSRRPTAALCSSMRSATCRWSCRPTCCA